MCDTRHIVHHWWWDPAGPQAWVSFTWLTLQTAHNRSLWTQETYWLLATRKVLLATRKVHLAASQRPTWLSYSHLWRPLATGFEASQGAHLRTPSGYNGKDRMARVLRGESNRWRNPWEEAQEGFALVREKPELCELGKGLIFNLLKLVNEVDGYLDIRKENGLSNSSGR